MRRSLCLTLGVSFLAISAAFAAPVIDPFYAGSYSLVNLGSAPGVPGPYGGLTFLAGNSNTLLLGGSANSGSGVIDAVGVTRDGGGHVNAFSGTASLFSTATNI